MNRTVRGDVDAICTIGTIEEILGNAGIPQKLNWSMSLLEGNKRPAEVGIRINAVCPGIIDTSMMGRFSGGTSEGRRAVIAREPVGKMGRPEEIAATVVRLCSDAASFVVGSAMAVNGDQTV